MRIYSWSTTKTENGYKATVAEVGHNHHKVVREIDGYRSRAIAARNAKKMKMQLTKAAA